MTTSLIPEQSVRLSTSGFKKFYKLAMTSPEQAEAVAKDVEADPRGFLHRVFKLTDHQKQMLEIIEEGDLSERVQVLVVELRSGTPADLHYQSNGPSKGKKKPVTPHPFGGSCRVVSKADI